MVRPIVTDNFLLGCKAILATPDDLAIAADLLDTLAAHTEECVGMAANMIGFNKRIIVAQIADKFMLFLNPVLVSTGAETYTAQEGCLSHTGTKPVQRFSRITIEYQDTDFRSHRAVYTGFEAQIIQHELDHCEGILI